MFSSIHPYYYNYMYKKTTTLDLWIWEKNINIYVLQFSIGWLHGCEEERIHSPTKMSFVKNNKLIFINIVIVLSSFHLSETVYACEWMQNSLIKFHFVLIQTHASHFVYMALSNFIPKYRIIKQFRFSSNLRSILIGGFSLLVSHIRKCSF